MDFYHRYSAMKIIVSCINTKNNAHKFYNINTFDYEDYTRIPIVRFVPLNNSSSMVRSYLNPKLKYEENNLYFYQVSNKITRVIDCILSKELRERKKELFCINEEYNNIINLFNDKKEVINKYEKLKEKKNLEIEQAKNTNQIKQNKILNTVNGLVNEIIEKYKENTNLDIYIQHMIKMFEPETYKIITNTDHYLTSILNICAKYFVFIWIFDYFDTVDSEDLFKRHIAVQYLYWILIVLTCLYPIMYLVMRLIKYCRKYEDKEYCCTSYSSYCKSFHVIAEWLSFIIFLVLLANITASRVDHQRGNVEDKKIYDVEWVPFILTYFIIAYGFYNIQKEVSKFHINKEPEYYLKSLTHLVIKLKNWLFREEHICHCNNQLELNNV